jgi:predicted HTH transcriptional regulator
MAAPIPANVALVASIERNFESKDLDYKETLIWSSDDKKPKCELVKDVLAMANTEGGQIVIGVSELGDGFLLTGVSEGCAASVETSELCRFVQIYADPPINLHVQKVIHKDLLFIVIEVPRFTDTPHLCQKDYPGVLQDRTLYVRTDNNESAPVRSSADFRSVIERAVRNKSEDLLSAMRAILRNLCTSSTFAS